MKFHPRLFQGEGDMQEHLQFSKFIDRTFNEVLQLLEDARDYTLLCRKEDVRGLAQDETLCVARESMRLTALLSEIMAWLLVQKAVNKGEMTAREAQVGDYRLNTREIYGVDGRGESTVFPARLGKLLDQSIDLYGRVSKMDRMVTRLYS